MGTTSGTGLEQVGSGVNQPEPDWPGLTGAGGFVLLHRVPRQRECVESAVCAGSVWSSLCSFGLPADSGAQVLSPGGFGDVAAAAAG